MTYSLVARDEDGTFGVVTASRSLAVGATVPAVAPGAGALVTQAYTNTTFAARGVDLLRRGLGAAEILDLLLRSDPEGSRRQVAVLGLDGEAAAWTGPDCTPPAGHLLGPGCVAAGNCLGGAPVLGALRDTFMASTGTLAHRLALALTAGQEAGGDGRGRQSSALVVRGPGDDGGLRNAGRVDLRVDDHADPVGELCRLLELRHADVEGPDRATALRLTGDIAREVDTWLAATGRGGGERLEKRLSDWARDENLEHRLLHGRIDLTLLERLRSRGRSVRRSEG
ncbi:DUF1028 domain-containing protein [Actinomadura sp. WMMA1423]|uniref:DUF1028 domain-containing protein n=1 Tax=Actinomadura sp. WMMA1423 TaxID=2591108 RepID=UPI00143D8CD9|nr:DUF1028 domain-containing protein [Actinomadura sp. WMMA1423]